MILPARFVSLAAFTAAVALPSLASADSITLPMLGLKESLAPAAEQWTRVPEVKAATPVRGVVSRKALAGTKVGVFLDFPALLTSRRTLPGYTFDKDAFVRSQTSFASSSTDGVDGRRKGSGSASSGGAAGGSGGGYGGVGSRSITNPTSSSQTSSDISDADVINRPPSEVSEFASHRNGFHTDSSSLRAGGGGNELLDDGIATSLEQQQPWTSGGGGQGISSTVGFSDELLTLPPVGSPLLDVKPWVSGFTPDAVNDDGQFVVYDFVSGEPVWTTDSLVDLLDNGSLTALVPNWDGSLTGSAAIANPEPASLLLFASGLIGAGMKWRATRRQRERK